MGSFHPKRAGHEPRAKYQGGLLSSVKVIKAAWPLDDRGQCVECEPRAREGYMLQWLLSEQTDVSDQIADSKHSCQVCLL